jgi:hypothetical protein
MEVDAVRVEVRHMAVRCVTNRRISTYALVVATLTLRKMAEVI